jgi:hypothetical protein
MATNQKITATFSEQMDANTVTAFGNFSVTGPGATPVPGNVTYDSTSFIATFTPNGSVFAPSTTFTATITTAAQSFPGELPLASNYVWTFKTGAVVDTGTPQVLRTNPIDLSSGTAINQKVTATFNEQMDSATIGVASFTLVGPGAVPVPGTVTYSTSSATAAFTPTGNLTPGSLYTATITTAATDLSGNALPSAFSWTFAIGLGPDSTPPTVTSTVPADLAPSVSQTAGINATFNEAMDPATINAGTFLVTVAPGPTVVAGKVTYDTSNNTATFTPTGPLTNGSTYSATITTGAMDLEGNALAANFLWSFTAGATAGLSPIDLGAATNFAAFAEAAINNTGATIVNGDLGLTPGSALNGFWPGFVNGHTEVDSPAATTTLADLGTAYGIGAGLVGPTLINENLASEVLFPGLYQSNVVNGSFEITGGSLTLDAQGDSNAVWVFQMPSSGGSPTLTLTNPTCKVLLINGAKAENVFWIVGSSATIGAGCDLEGSILADTSITIVGGATVNGRALAGAVTLTGVLTMDTNKVNVPACN